jgi:hypothetical protein
MDGAIFTIIFPPSFSFPLETQKAFPGGTFSRNSAHSAGIDFISCAARIASFYIGLLSFLGQPRTLPNDAAGRLHRRGASNVISCILKYIHLYI